MNLKEMSWSNLTGAERELRVEKMHRRANGREPDALNYLLPMDIAPKDRVILLYGGCRDDTHDIRGGGHGGMAPDLREMWGGSVAVGWWDHDGEEWRFAEYDMGFYGAFKEAPTGWMPLPRPWAGTQN
jgi:hypothetical protein